MSSQAKANWFTGDLDQLGDEVVDDPFEMETIGKPIDLSDRRGSLQARLHELVKREGRLYNKGVTCAIRDTPNTCCAACPYSEALNKDSALGVLCRVGREQEQVATTLTGMAKRGER